MKIIFLFIILLSSASTFSQGVFNNNTNLALQKVIEDYPNNFNNIRGDKISGNQQTADYQSKIIVPGAGASIITRHSTSRAEVFSWKAEMFESGNFEESKERFKKIFDNIKNTIVKIDGLPPYILSGKYEYPAEDKKSTSIAFQLLPANGELQKLTVDLTLHNIPGGWKISLSVHEKDVDGLAAN